MLHAFAYSSHMSAGLSDEMLRQIVSRSATFNRRVDVTGALLVDGQRFFQYVEGPPDGLEASSTASMTVARMLPSCRYWTWPSARVLFPIGP